MTTPLSDLVLPHDLTRWNRAGLRRFRYIRGNAIEYLELLREELTERLPTWTALALPGPDADAGTRMARVLAQYAGPRRDPAWEIARTFARAAHVLGEHVDAFANEGFTETATQWELLRRLVAMIDYHPAPPASAFTVLALLAKPGASGRVAAGLPVKYAPPGGAPPVLFETLAELPIDARLNTMRLARWDVSEEPFDPMGDADAGWRADEAMALSVGSVGLLVQTAPAQRMPDAPLVTGAAQAIEVAAVDPTSGTVRIAGPSSTSAVIWRRGSTTLLVGAARVRRPRLNGPGVFRLERGSSLARGDVVAWNDGGWRFATVEAADGDRLRITGALRPATDLQRATMVAPSVGAAGVAEYRLPLSMLAAAHRLSANVLAVLERNAFTTVSFHGTPSHLTLASAAPPQELLVVLAGAATLGRPLPLDDDAGTLRFEGTARGISTGTWLVAERRDASGSVIRRALRASSVEQREREWVLGVEDHGEALTPPNSAVTADLRERLRFIEPLLDQAAFGTILLRDLVSGAVAHRSAAEIQGAGARFSARLAPAGVRTIGDLAAVPPTRRIAGLGETVLRELAARARQVLAFGEVDTRTLSPFLATTLRAALGLVTGHAQVRPSGTAGLEVERIYGPFAHRLAPLGHDRNAEPLPDRARLRLAMPPDALPVAFKPGRLLIIEDELGMAPVHQSTIDRVEPDPSSGTTVVRLREPIPASTALTVGSALVLGNAVPAGHGEAKGGRVLGSGDAARRNQEFDLAVPGISFVPDATMPTGVRADVVLIVDGERWTQVSSLRDSRATDAHYVVRVMESGGLRFACGDGDRGRRLPTGANNVRVTYRLGSGLAGNQPPNRLVKLGTPHPLVAAVRQPLPAVGGDDIESVAAIRVNAPASVRTMERAVSLGDYANLAASQSGVWQAIARPGTGVPGRDEHVEVILVPAGGATLDGDLQPVVPTEFLLTQRELLRHGAPPGTLVSIRVHEPVILDIRVTVRVRSAAFDRAVVIDRVRQAVLAAYRLERRRLGAAAHRSDLYGVVEAVPGVENSSCELALAPIVAQQGRPRRVVMQADGTRQVARSIDLHPHQVAYVDAERSTVLVTASEYEL